MTEEELGLLANINDKLEWKSAVRTKPRDKEIIIAIDVYGCYNCNFGQILKLCWNFMSKWVYRSEVMRALGINPKIQK